MSDVNPALISLHKSLTKFNSSCLCGINMAIIHTHYSDVVRATIYYLRRHYTNIECTQKTGSGTYFIQLYMSWPEYAALSWLCWVSV